MTSAVNVDTTGSIYQEIGQRAIYTNIYTNIRIKSSTVWSSCGPIDLERIPDAIADLEVHMGTRGLARASHVGDDLPLPHVLAERGDNARGVRIQCLTAVVVLNDHIAAV